MNEEDKPESKDSGVNISRLRQMAAKGDKYRESATLTYYGEEGEIFYRPLIDDEFLPIAAVLEDKLDIDPEEAQAMIEEEREAAEELETTIDASVFDPEFVEVMKWVCVWGTDTTQGIGEGEDLIGLCEIYGTRANSYAESVAMALNDESVPEGRIGLQGGKTLEIAENILEISSDAEKADKFRRDGGRK